MDNYELAQHQVDAMDLGTLVEYAVQQLADFYNDNPLQAAKELAEIEEGDKYWNDTQ